MVFGLTELLVNAVEHGNLGITYEEKTRLREQGRWEEEVASRLAAPEYAEKQVRVSYSRERDQIRVRIEDEGQGFEWQRYVDMDLERAFDTHGRGIAMSRMISFDDVQYLGVGNTVEVTVRIEAQDEQDTPAAMIA